LSDNSESFNIKISKEVAGVTIEVIVESPDRFDNAFILLRNLSRRALVGEARASIERFWVQKDGLMMLDERIHESSYRIALSLLMSWPDPKMAVQIASETGLHSGSVSRVLLGRRMDVSEWFMKLSDGWTLSQTGLTVILNEIIPNLTDMAESEI
jgi:hypothetical protein